MRHAKDMPRELTRELGILYKPDMHLAIREDRKTQTRRIVTWPKWMPNPSWSGYHMKSCPEGISVLWEGATGWCDGLVKPRYRVGDRLYVKEAFASPSKHIVAYKLGAECGAWMDDGGRFFHRHGLILESPDYSIACRERKSVDTYGLAKYGGVPRGEFPYRYGWKSPLHMPKWAARTWLEVTGVRAERLQDISEADAIAEGVAPLFTAQERASRPEYDVEGHRNYLWHGWVGKTITQKQADAWPHQYSSYDTARGSYSSLWESINGPGSWAANPWVWVYEFRRIER